ncbi:hypothetical protein KEM48_011408 [Puccinia striiformis f. sp. tritici PST-130]|nr:hypothetical protein KEM48_011408 [Puccinia striiformis f. sp. tritici PST-130]
MASVSACQNHGFDLSFKEIGTSQHTPSMKEHDLTTTSNDERTTRTRKNEKVIVYEIEDLIYGKVIIESECAIEIMNLPEFQRLKDVLQHGITALIGLLPSPPVNRFDHSVGAMILVKHVGGSEEAQLAALLHDVSHTALSHVTDSVFGYVVHEVEKDVFLAKTQIPNVLRKHGFAPERVFREELFPLLELPSPEICADRLDYALRDSVSFGHLTIPEAQEIYRSTISRDGKMVLNRLDQPTAEAIKLSLKEGTISKESLWINGDRAFWGLLVDNASPQVKQIIERINPTCVLTEINDKCVVEPSEQRMVDSRSSSLQERCTLKIRVRTIDPPVLTATGIYPLSTLDPDFSQRRSDYIRSPETHTIDEQQELMTMPAKITSTTTSTTSTELSFAAATQASLDRWKIDLQNLLRHADKRFADIAWSRTPGAGTEDLICAHKAIIYARASGQFQLKYLSAPAPSPHSRLPGLPSTSSVYLNGSIRSNTPQSAISNQRPPSPSLASLHSIAGSTRQLSLLNGTDPTLFQSILEALYTANGLSEVFAFLFDDHAAADSPEARTDKLRKDLLYMWRSKLYADCQIILINQQDLDNPTENSTYEQEAVFSAHRSILCSRSPYFASLLLDPYADSNNRVFTLASPPFTPASLHFSLGYLYCGTLDFSNRNFDLSTAMQIWRSAQYLGLELLREEVEAKISEMCHNFKDTCKSCISRIGRVYAFSLALDVASKRLESATEPFVIQHLGTIWNKAIGELHYEAQTHLVDLVCLSIDPNTVIGAIQGSKRLKDRLANERSDWADHLLSMLEPIDEQIGVVLQQKFPAVVTSKGFLDLLVGVGFSNDVLEKALILMVQRLTDDNAAETYQVLVGQVLLREDGLPMDARVIVEDAKAGVLKYIKSHWTTLRALNGFDPLENWALKEISDGSSRGPSPFNTRAETSDKDWIASFHIYFQINVREDVTSVSAASLRASVLGRNATRTQPTRAQQSPVTSPKKDRLTKIVTNINPNSARVPRASENSPAPITSPRLKTQSSLSSRRSPPQPLSITTSYSCNQAEKTIRKGSCYLTSCDQKRHIPKLDGAVQSSKTDAGPKSPKSASSSSSHRLIETTTTLPSSCSSAAPRRRPASPAPSVNSVISKTLRTQTGSSALKARRATDPKKSDLGSTASSSSSKPPRARTTTTASIASTRSTAVSVSSIAQRKSVANHKPPVVRKIPSSVSMRSDASTTTIGAQRTRVGSSNATKTTVGLGGIARPIEGTTKKASHSPANLTFPSKSDRLRTSSATARTGAAANVAVTVPHTPTKRPSSVTSVRTAVSPKASGSGGAASGLVSPTRSATIKSSIKLKTRQSDAVPPLPSSTSPPGTSNSNNKLPGRIGSPRVRSTSTTTATTTTARSRKPTMISKSCDSTEILADLTSSSDVSDVPSEQSIGSSVSNSTIRLPASQHSTTDDPPPNTIIVTSSSTTTINQHRTTGTTTTQPINPSKPPGTVLLIGIPCVVATTITLTDGLEQPIKFRAVVKYLGETYFGPGQWVGVEVAEKEEMIHKEWNDGTVNGIKYFELGQESKESKLRLFRNLSATPSGSSSIIDRSHSSNSNHLLTNNSDLVEGASLNSLRPSFVSTSSRSFLSNSGVDDERPTRGLFVRPQEVIFGAKDKNPTYEDA